MVKIYEIDYQSIPNSSNKNNVLPHFVNHLQNFVPRLFADCCIFDLYKTKENEDNRRS